MNILPFRTLQKECLPFWVIFSGLWTQKHILSRKDYDTRDKLPYLDVTWLGGSASGSYSQKLAPVPLFTDWLPLAFDHNKHLQFSRAMTTFHQMALPPNMPPIWSKSAMPTAKVQTPCVNYYHRLTVELIQQLRHQRQTDDTKAPPPVPADLRGQECLYCIISTKCSGDA
jgi:hypothetical protein